MNYTTYSGVGDAIDFKENDDFDQVGLNKNEMPARILKGYINLQLM